ncbi:MAG: MraY family glycosyltransferase [Chloroflexi bacterium]|nr:MraY family glycosyltransferase [Chloroflexota bacterium]
MDATVILLFFGALVLSIGLTPISKWLARRFGVMAIPRSRDVHSHPVPRMGGTAIFLAVLMMAVLLRTRAEFLQMAALLAGAAMMSFLGLVDDRFQLNAYIKLVVQLVAGMFAWYFGIRIQLFQSAPLDAAVTILWLVGITNAMNFLDNMDGLLAGISAVASAFFLVLAVLNGQILVGLLSAAVLGACAGFLFWNLNPASVFMGDSGSMFLGFLLACIAIKLRFIGQATSVSWLTPVIVLSLPLFDVTMVSISRLRRGKNPLTTPGRDHVSHRITNNGYSKREAVLILYLVCGALGVTAVIASASDVWANILIAAALLCVAAFFLWLMEFGPWKLKRIDWEASPKASSVPSSAETSA